ncbi:YceI family protein [Hymenobacter aquaticus]|uniref:YceI family protein n=1 Tax=Hymenobacter aquaticus TaxID=1867101 RepID=A0A4Z0PXI0_9BACT|nr:YceI family protein [Hymenobacter aquaticus]TGE21956.1 YceI family protein [Hymenobacter aquaticus]
MFFLRPVAAKAALLLAPVAGLLAGSWNLDPGYSIKFAGSQAEGTFTGLAGTVIYNPADLGSASMRVTVDAATIRTGNSLKDKHARGESWFDVAKYPKIYFQSTAFTRAGNGYAVRGELTLHGVKKPVTIPFQFSQQADKAVFTGQFRVNRKDFGINGNALGFTVGEVFEVTLRVPVSR